MGLLTIFAILALFIAILLYAIIASSVLAETNDFSYIMNHKVGALLSKYKSIKNHEQNPVIIDKIMFLLFFVGISLLIYSKFQ